MFQYAYYLELKQRDFETYFDISDFADYKLHHGYELNRIFGVTPLLIEAENTPEFKHILQLRRRYEHGYGHNKHRLFIDRLRNKLRIGNCVIVQRNFGYDLKYIHFKPSSKHSYLLDGYWQSEKYFASCVNQVRQAFKFPSLDKGNQLIAQQIEQVNSVSVHVRRGDYVNNPLHGDICTLDYYKRAIGIINSKIANPQFYVFSDDVAWCKDNLSLPNAVYVDGNQGKNSYKDMQLISLCKCNIIANSSFSWWGAWLNINSNKVVIAPRKWFNDTRFNVSDLLPNEWIKI